MAVPPALGRLPISRTCYARDSAGLTVAGLTSYSDQCSTRATDPSGDAMGTHGVYSFPAEAHCPMRLGFWPTPYPLDQSVVEPILGLYFHECFSVSSKQKPMIAEQPWALDEMSFGLACLDRRSNQDGQYNSKGGARASGGREGPRLRSGRTPSLPLRCRCIGHRFDCFCFS
jgi:hypothetical protein